MVVLTCFLTRRRIGAYLDEALEDVQAQSIAKHLSRCSRCQAEAENIRRVRALLQRTLLEIVVLKMRSPKTAAIWS